MGGVSSDFGGPKGPPVCSSERDQSNEPSPAPFGPLLHDRRSSTQSQSTSLALDALVTQPAPLVWRMTLVASLSGLLFGYDTGYVASVLVGVGTDLGHPLSTGEMEWISGGASGGALIGTAMAGIAVDMVGRKVSMVLCDLLFVAGALMQVMASSVRVMVLGRVVVGLGVGLGSLCAPLYIGELSPGKFRGSLVVVNCLAITGGQLLAYAMGALLIGMDNGWRYVVLISTVPALAQLLALLRLPDTPRYLIMVRRFVAARAVLQEVYPTASDTLLDANVAELAGENHVWGNESPLLDQMLSSWKTLTRRGASRRALVIACSLQAIQQLCGFNALMYFSTTIFQMVGYTNATMVSCLVAGTNFLVTCVALVVIDRVGRRRIMLLSLPVMALCQLLCGLAFVCLDSDPHWHWVLLWAMVGFVASYAIGVGNVPWQQAELFPQDVRGLGSSLSTGVNWCGSLMVSMSFLSLMELLSPAGAFTLCAMVSILSCIFVWMAYPEMGGLTLEEVGLVLDRPLHEAVPYSLRLRVSRVNAAGGVGLASAARDVVSDTSMTIFERPLSEGSLV